MRSRCSDMSLKSFAKIMAVGKGKYICPLAKIIVTGNTKLPKTTAIFNLSSAHDCPSFKLGLCRAFTKEGKHVCYALKSETSMRPDVQPFRDRQMDFWLRCTAEEFAWQFLFINALKELPWTALRFNEAGDFHSQRCIEKVDKIAMLLKRCGIVTYGYTCRSDLDYSNVKHMVLSGSSFEKEGITNVFMMVEDIKTDRPKGYGVCCGNCKVCNRCMVRGMNTVIKRH